MDTKPLLFQCLSMSRQCYTIATSTICIVITYAIVGLILIVIHFRKNYVENFQYAMPYFSNKGTLYAKKKEKT